MKTFIKFLKSIRESFINWKNKPPKHKHKREYVRYERMVGTNRYIDGKEIQKKVYRYDIKCKECKKTLDKGDEYDMESWNI